MDIRRLAVLVFLALLPATALVLAQSRARQAPTPPRRPASIRPEPAPAEPVKSGPGIGNPPNAGYVVMPEAAPAGTVTSAAIPADPVDRAYWELYDRSRSITITGKVTSVEWTIPNTYIYLSTASGSWAVESAFTQFRQANVTPAVRIDETITVMGYLPKEDPPSELPARKSGRFTSYLRNNHLVRASEITTTFGQKLALGRPPTDLEMVERLKCSPLGC